MKINLSGNAFVVKSSMAVKDIELLAKNAPDKLKLKDDEGNVLFSISYNESHPSLTKFGFAFDGKTRDEEELATFTGQIPAGTEDVKGYIADKLCPVIAHLEKFEISVPEAAQEVQAEQDKLAEELEATRTKIIEMITEA